VHGLTAEHFEALEEACATATDPRQRQYLREVRLICLQAVQGAELAESLEDTLADPEQPLTDEDLALLQGLLLKGVQHNGVVPELSALQVHRALRHFSALANRAATGVLTAEDLDFLEWIFDEAADIPRQRRLARRVEGIVRGGLGLEQRLTPPLPGGPLS
jgi:hypothetical protein